MNIAKREPHHNAWFHMDSGSHETRKKKEVRWMVGKGERLVAVVPSGGGGGGG